jgi:hypothetical protein
VKAVAIQLSPMVKCARPNSQPSWKAREARGARAISSMSQAIPRIVAGHHPSGWKPQAARAPAPSAPVWG